VPAIREKSLRLTQRILDGAAARGWKVWTPSEAARRGGTVSVGVPEAPRVCEELARRDVIVDWRPEVGLRIGPHFYNSEEDVDRALAEIESLVTVRR
jgi:kynureninase